MKILVKERISFVILDWIALSLWIFFCNNYFVIRWAIHINIQYAFIKVTNSVTRIPLFCFDSTGINWKLWTILQSWLCFDIIVLLHGTILPWKTILSSRHNAFHSFITNYNQLKISCKTCWIFSSHMSIESYVMKKVTSFISSKRLLTKKSTILHQAYN